MRVQGHSGSKFIVPIESPRLVYCLMSLEYNVTSLTVFKIFELQLPVPRPIDNSRSTKVNDHDANPYRIGGFLFDFH